MSAPLAISPQALRVLVGPDIKIVPGRAVMARVVRAAPGQKGSLSVAGYLLDAELPEDVQAGQDLRLVVRDVNAERVLLAITDPREAEQDGRTQESRQAEQSGQAQQDHQTQGGAGPDHAQAADPALAAQAGWDLVPLPGGGNVQVTERDGGGARAAERHDVLLRYHAPALGAVDLRFQMDAGALSLSVSLAPGQPLERAQASAESLRRALAASLPGRAVSVTVAPRREPLDLYA